MEEEIVTKDPDSWKPDRPTSKGASAYHDAVKGATWNHACIDELVMLADPQIKDDDVVVDFGAGTGTSATRIIATIKKKIKLWLVDNSPSWLGKAYEMLHEHPGIKFFILEKKNSSFATLNETIGENKAQSVISANTVHLIPNLKEAFSGVLKALKPQGIFVFNSGNIVRKDRPDGVLMLDSTVYRVHDIALDIINKDDSFKEYRADLDKKVEAFTPLRKFIFPEPKPLETYIQSLKEAGFKYLDHQYKQFRLKYSDWIKFLRVKRLQAGILPEVGGKEPTPKEIEDRDKLISLAAEKLFKELEEKNPHADNASYLGEWIYISATKA